MALDQYLPEVLKFIGVEDSCSVSIWFKDGSSLVSKASYVTLSEDRKMLFILKQEEIHLISLSKIRKMSMDDNTFCYPLPNADLLESLMLYLGID